MLSCPGRAQVPKGGGQLLRTRPICMRQAQTSRGCRQRVADTFGEVLQRKAVTFRLGLLGFELAGRNIVWTYIVLYVRFSVSSADVLRLHRSSVCYCQMVSTPLSTEVARISSLYL